jgi:hypothetical protein
VVSPVEGAELNGLLPRCGRGMASAGGGERGNEASLMALDNEVNLAQVKGERSGDYRDSCEQCNNQAIGCFFNV